MTISEADYFSIRSKLLQEQAKIVALEEKYTNFLLEVTMSAVSSIYEDFSQAMQLKPFWANYPPVQRGRSPRGTSIPWGEVGEKTISACLVRAISLKNQSITYPGLPLGGDIRFATSDALIHFDIKLTGPNDNPDEVVASPHQISGDGLHWIMQSYYLIEESNPFFICNPFFIFLANVVRGRPNTASNGSWLDFP